MARILVLGMNPAWQTVLTLPRIQLGGVNRAGESQSLASGKGMNCARVLARMGHDVTLVQVLAGEFGKRCLDACEKAGIRSVHIWADGETRQCLTLRNTADHSVTEIIEPFAVDYRKSWGDTLLKHLEELGRIDASIFLGSLPNGWAGSFYAEALARVQGDTMVLDTLQGLSWVALRQAHWVKVNSDEWNAFKAATPRPLDELSATWHAFITQGSEPAWVEKQGRVMGTIEIPGIEVVNPIGAGDTVTAGLVHHLLMGRNIPTAVTAALGMGMASCLDILPAHYAPEDAEAFQAKLHWNAKEGF
jgi:fructose-1-phosphate kinase PfkB-like protein